MFDNKRIIAIIPARGGSKGIPNKNIVEVCGKPLIEYTISAAKESCFIDRIYVSTDSLQIASVCQSCGVEVSELRPKELANDQAKTIDTIKYTLRLLELKNEHYDYVVLLQPTQPLRRVFHIDEAIQLIVPSQRESIVSVTEVSEHPIFMRSLNADGQLKPILNVSSTVRRQDLGTLYRVNGAIYINKVSHLLERNISLNDNDYPYIMEKEYDLDIDTEEDLKRFIQLQQLKGAQFL